MTTPKDLLTIALEMESDRSAEPGDLSLALAGAELIDLLDVQAVRLEGERIVPAQRSATGDHLLDEASASLVRQEPYESVDDWLWRRGRGLFSAYVAAVDSEAQVAQRERPWRRLRAGHTIAVESSVHRAAVESRIAEDAVLAALAIVAGIHGERTFDFPAISDVSVATVLAALNDAVMELGLERQRLAIEGDAFDNVWRGL